MSFEGPDVDNYGGDEDGHRKRDTSRKRDGKKDKKEKGYMMFEEEDSDGDSLALADDLKSPSKAKGSKAKPFKFPVRKEKTKEKEEKKDKEAKKEEKEKRREEKEGKKLKKEKKKSKLNLQGPAVTIADPTDYDNPIFGVSLALAVERNKSHDGIELPAIVRECVDYIEECGLACEGIYRISGVKSKVQALKDSYNRHQPIYLYEHEPNIVASLLKQFLRDLPEAVLTTSMMPKFEEASTAKSNKKKVELFSKLITELPACNRLLLSWMIVHMSHVIDLAKENKMTLQNVSIVLSPTMRISHRVLNVLFSNSQALFGDVQLRKYVPPLRPAHSKWSLELPDNLSSLEEELAKQESLLNQLHTDLNSGVTDPVIEEQLWEVQRVVTQLKRKIKLAKKGTEKNEGSRPATGEVTKRSSNSSLPSLSAPEELRLDLKPVPSSAPNDAVTDTNPTSAAVTTVDVEPQTASSKDKEDSQEAPTVTTKGKRNSQEPQPVSSKDKEESQENTVTLETSKTVKFAGVIDRKKSVVNKENEKDGKKDEKEEKKEGKAVKEVKSETEGKGKKEETGKEEKKEEEVKEEPDGEELRKPEEKEQKEEEGKKKEVVADGEKSDKNKKDSESLQEEEEPTKDMAKKDKVNKSTVEKNGEKEKVRPEVKGKNEKDAETKKEKESNRQGENKEDGEKEKGDRRNKSIPAPPQSTDSGKHPSVPVPPFMSLTLLEPVKAETPARKKSEGEVVTGLEDDGKLEEWKELEDELLGKKKKKKEKTSDHSKIDPEEEEVFADEVSTEQLLEDEYALIMEEEELTAIADELRQKMATEHSEMERLAQEIQELHYLRQDSDLEDSSDSNSSDESEDEDEIQDLLSQLLQDNQGLETQNAEMCQKIHEERMICLSVKLQIRLLQQKQLEASCG